jgi:hypothetical protein
MTRSLADAWARQIAWCDGNGSPFTARVLEAAWADREQGGALAAQLPPADGWPGDAGADAVPLRVAGALHALALSGRDGELAALYPPRQEHFDAARAPTAIARAMASHADVIAEYLAVAPQTNEIGRSAVLLPGFAAIAQATGLPLATFEIGASAGLNQLWHHYRYALGGVSWGPADSEVVIRADWQGAAPQLPQHIAVASHAACDMSPIDLSSDSAARRLMSYVWPDQRDRVERLRAAIALAQRLQLCVDAADALTWLQDVLATQRPGRATVIYHSVMWQYLPEPTRNGLRGLIEASGAHATAQAPLAWLAFEPPAADAHMLLTLTLWPGGERRTLAAAHPHGQWIRWLAG